VERKEDKGWGVTGGYDYSIIVSALFLVAIGIVMTYSASCILAQERFGDSFLFLRRQSLFAFFGVVGMICAIHFSYENYRKLVYPFMALALALLVLVLLPGAQGHSRAHRWLSVGGMSFQPSEWAKLVLVMYMAHSLAKKREKGTIKSFSLGFLPHAMAAGAMMLLLLKEPDLGATLVVGTVAFLMMFMAGVRWRYLIISIIPGAFFLFHKLQGYQWDRIDTFLKYFTAPWEATLKDAYHLKQACYALANGGLLGVGVGMGKQKLFYLPEPHTDFIIAVIGEEWGLVGIAVVCLFYGVLIMGGAKVAMALKDPFGSLLAMGIVTLVGLQALANMAMAVGLLPTKGMALPLVSYGGSSLLVNLWAVGILVQLSARAHRQGEGS